jgi:hypothetical protein
MSTLKKSATEKIKVSSKSSWKTFEQKSSSKPPMQSKTSFSSSKTVKTPRSSSMVDKIPSSSHSKSKSSKSSSSNQGQNRSVSLTEKPTYENKKSVVFKLFRDLMDLSKNFGSIDDFKGEIEKALKEPEEIICTQKVVERPKKQEKPSNKKLSLLKSMYEDLNDITYQPEIEIVKIEPVLSNSQLKKNNSNRRVDFNTHPQVQHFEPDEHEHSDCNEVMVDMETSTPLVTYLGVIDVDPNEYMKHYADQLCKNLPQFILDIQFPQEMDLTKQNVQDFELEGDVEALKLVPDLDKAGLGEYKSYLKNIGILSKK